MLVLDRRLRDAMVEHARRDHPDEACGVIAGPAGKDEAIRLVRMTNAERSPTFFRFDSQEQLKVWMEMDDNDEEPVVIYHSHTATEAYPSRTDIAYAAEPNAHYVIVSTRASGNDVGPAEIRSYRIVDGAVTEEPITIREDNPREAGEHNDGEDDGDRGTHPDHPADVYRRREDGDQLRSHPRGAG